MTSPSVPDIRHFQESRSIIHVSHTQTLSTAVGYFYDNEIVCANNEKVTMIWTWSVVGLLWHPQISAQILPCAPPWSPGRVLGSIIPGNHDACLWRLLDTCSAVSAVSAGPSSPPSSVIMMIHHNWVCLSFKSPPPHHLITLHNAGYFVPCLTSYTFHPERLFCVSSSDFSNMSSSIPISCAGLARAAQTIQSWVPDLVVTGRCFHQYIIRSRHRDLNISQCPVQCPVTPVHCPGRAFKNGSPHSCSHRKL